DAPEEGIGWLIEDTKDWGATRHCQTEHQQKDQRQPPDALQAGLLAQDYGMDGTPLQPLADFGSEEEHRRAQQTEIDEGQWQGQKDAQMETELAQQAAPLARMASAAEQ